MWPLTRNVTIATLEQLKNVIKIKWSWIEMYMTCKTTTVEMSSICCIEKKRTYSARFLLICRAYEVCCTVPELTLMLFKLEQFFVLLCPLFHESV